MNKTQRHRSIEHSQHTGRTRTLTTVHSIQSMRLQRWLGVGPECHLKKFVDSELPKGFKTGNDMSTWEW